MDTLRWFLTIHFLAILSVAQPSPASQVELNGFLIGQYVKAADGTFGKPTQVTTTDDHWTYRAYIFDQKHEAYMVFKFPSWDKERIFTIQIAGDAGTPMRPFLGLVLGDDRSKVQEALGTPEKIEHEKDYPVDLYTYAQRNYSVEINRKGKLSSIQIMGYDGFAKEPDTGVPDIEVFRKAIVSNDVGSLLQILAGDLEIQRGNQTYDFDKSARAELEDPNSRISRLLFGEKDSLKTAFTTEKFLPDTQLRIYEHGPPGSVVKFEHSKIVLEVVYKAEAGKWKIWEIQLR